MDGTGQHRGEVAARPGAGGLVWWFVDGAVGLNGAAGAIDPAEQRLRVANAGWARWTPVNLAGIAAHIAGGSMLLVANKGRLAGQREVATATIAKTALTGLGLAATGYSRVLGAAAGPHQLDRLLVVEDGDRLVGILSEADIRHDEGPLASSTLGPRARRRR